MPYVLYNTSTGKITGGPYYRIPTNAGQLAAITAAGEAIMEVPPGINAGNSFIDLNTAQAAPTGPAMTHVFRYAYDTATGMLMSHVNGLIENGAIPASSPGLIVSTSAIPELKGGKALTLDATGNPTMNPDGTYIVSPAPYEAMPPSALDLLLFAHVNAGNLDPSVIPAIMLANMNANLATVGAATITAPANHVPAAPSAS